MHRRANNRRLRALAVQCLSVNAGSMLVDNFLLRRAMLSGVSLEEMEQEEDDGTYVVPGIVLPRVSFVWHGPLSLTKAHSS
jgi:hypothetical protein